ncbi:hypothetical protein APY04_1234 [Hyphomicrobium sulfonivorans]|uniref:Uncharacterized protein n=1 Tax=Hyphomicrobium sulfonivorans TaxID=121290 RepID=A0A109BK89_HYPSL|nr:hypothetical protein APY04_1234 [Hyphomicrobium sulfonivorans]
MRWVEVFGNGFGHTFRAPDKILLRRRRCISRMTKRPKNSPARCASGQFSCRCCF